MKKRGQFYIITALIIISIIAVFAVNINYSEKMEFQELYDLSEELETESEKVLDYGVYNSLDEDGMDNLLKDFTEIYAEYKGDERDLYFIFGDGGDSTIVGYIGSGDIEDEQIIDSIKITDKTGSEFYLIESDSSENYASKTYDITSSPDKKITAEINDIEYNIELKGEEYLYFVINQEIEDQYYIISSEKEGKTKTSVNPADFKKKVEK